MAPPFRVAARADRPDANHDGEIFAICICFTLLSLAGLVARLVSKRMKAMWLHIDDILLIAAWLMATAESIIFMWGAQKAGFGHHYASLSEAQVIDFEKMVYAADLLQPTLFALAKVSVLILLNRIFAVRAFRLASFVLIAVVVVWWFGAFFAGIFICVPISSRWDPAIPGQCGNEVLLNIVLPIPWIVTDLLILLLPLPMVRKLHVPLKQKIMIAGLFLIGGLSLVASCIRYSYVFPPLVDPTWDLVGLGVWNIIEAHITILAVSLVASKPLIKLLWPELLIFKVASYWRRSLRRASSVDSHFKARRGTSSSEHSRKLNGDGPGFHVPDGVDHEDQISASPQKPSELFDTAHPPRIGGGNGVLESYELRDASTRAV